MHDALNKPFPNEDFQIDITLQALKRKISKTPFQVLPITAEILVKLYLFIDINNPADLAIWCMFLVAFFCFFRKKSLVPESLDKFDSQRGLSRKTIITLSRRKCSPGLQ